MHAVRISGDNDLHDDQPLPGQLRPQPVRRDGLTNPKGQARAGPLNGFPVLREDLGMQLRRVIAAPVDHHLTLGVGKGHL